MKALRIDPGCAPVELEIENDLHSLQAAVGGYGTSSWWVRSPFASGSYSFVGVFTGGTVAGNSAYCSCGFAPGFDL